MSEAEFASPDTAAGHPALVFLNTVSDSGKTRNQNTFSSTDSLVALLLDGGLDVPVTATGAGQLQAVLDLREAAYAVFSALAAQRTPSREDALSLDIAIKSAVADAVFSPGQARGAFQPGPMGGLHDILALCLLDLSQSPDLNRLKECRACSHLFLDKGRGPGRRWCSMARCGNRAKAQSFRARKRTAE